MMDYEKMASSIKEEIIKTLKEWISFPSVLNESEAKREHLLVMLLKGH